MQRYLEYSAQRVQAILPVTDWQQISLEQHEILAAFRVRFSEFQEHLDKTMGSPGIAVVDTICSYLRLFMCSIGCDQPREIWESQTMRAVALEEVQVDKFGVVLAFMEKLQIIESTERWKIIREFRNAFNHEYEEDDDRLSQFFMETLQATPELFDCFERLLSFCDDAYGVKPE